jgi:hypothetical protein
LNHHDAVFHSLQSLGRNEMLQYWELTPNTSERIRW